MAKFEISYEKCEPVAQGIISEQPELNLVVNKVQNTDGPFQKTLCYTSYYVMTFTAFCVFSPDQVAHAADLIQSGIPGSIR